MPLSSLIPVSAWAWDKYGKTITDKAADAFKGRWNKFKWSDAAVRIPCENHKAIRLDADHGDG
jgi:hypothetical protein